MMILRIGNCRTRSANARQIAAFTLVELILVMAMLMIVLGVAFPSLRDFFRGRNLDSEARRFLSLTRYGQSRAVSEGVPMMLWVSPRDKMYGLQAQPGYTDVDQKAVEFNIDKDIEVDVTASPSTARGAAAQITLAAMGVVTAIRFTPDGFIGETSIESVAFRQGDEDQIWITQSTNRLRYEILPNNYVPVRVRR